MLSSAADTDLCVFKDLRFFYLENTLRGSFWSVCGGGGDDRSLVITGHECMCTHMLRSHIHQTNALPPSHSQLCFVCCAMREICILLLQILFSTHAPLFICLQLLRLCLATSFATARSVAQIDKVSEVEATDIEVQKNSRRKSWL